MSASNRNEVLTLDKKAGDVMEKNTVRRLFDVQPTFIFILSEMCDATDLYGWLRDYRFPCAI